MKQLRCGLFLYTFACFNVSINRPVIVERESTVVPMEEDTKSQHRDSTDQDLNVVAEEIVQQYMERVSKLFSKSNIFSKSNSYLR